MIYFADLHVHSRFSRATSRDLTLPELAKWAAFKGVRVVATGDFTHPGWRSEIQEVLTDAGDGLFRLKADHMPSHPPLPGGFGVGDVRFILNGEISSIYKKGGLVRKVHHLIFMPDLDALDRFTRKLDRIGNLASDGRPILGLDSRHLLEMALDSSADSYLIPAHVWTPWFSVLGSKSGFDSVEECFEDLADHIFALETGLSSDPAMNHRVSFLDRFTLISNSDAHSPSKIGREANIFVGTPSYYAIRDAIRAGGAWARGLNPLLLAEEAEKGFEPAVGNEKQAIIPRNGFVGTIEFFPEEGKYHFDGHRKCNIRLDPRETEKLGGRCPVCGRPVTVGVMNRVLELGDREKGVMPEHAAPYWTMLPLPEIIAQVLDVGEHSKAVETAYFSVLNRFGPELCVLWGSPLEPLAQELPWLLVEAIRKVRQGNVLIEAGYDGEYGTVRLFTPEERRKLAGQHALFDIPVPVRRRMIRAPKAGQSQELYQQVQEAVSSEGYQALNQEQLDAVSVFDRPVVVQAGPGTGKTRTLTYRIAEIIRRGIAEPSQVTAVTFTRKAAKEIQERLQTLLSREAAAQCWVGTFHQLGERILAVFRDLGLFEGRQNIVDDETSLRLFRDAVRQAGVGIPPSRVPALYESVSRLKQGCPSIEGSRSDRDILKVLHFYENCLAAQDALDLDDLLVRPVKLLTEYPLEARAFAEQRAAHLLVDEFQDVNPVQYQLMRLLSRSDGAGLFVIGDPDQAIYGFRGADRNLFFRFSEDFPATKRVRLVRNYRSQASIIRFAEQIWADGREQGLIPIRPDGEKIKMVYLPNPATEAEFIARAIDGLVGGSSFFSLESRDAPLSSREDLGFRDFAILYRLNAVGDNLETALKSKNIPFQRARRAHPQNEAEDLDPRAEAVTLMTIHAAKGLEFRVVFVVGCEDGIIPYMPPDAKNQSGIDLEEERRLLYVAITRAQDALFLTTTKQRTLHGRTKREGLSRFLKNLHGSLVEMVRPLPASRRNARGGPKQGSLFGI